MTVLVKGSSMKYYGNEIYFLEKCYAGLSSVGGSARHVLMA
jgi:hypothetical protein